MDLLKEKYLNLLKESEGDFPQFECPRVEINGQKIDRVGGLIKLPKFLKHTSLVALELRHLNIKSLVNCPKTELLFLYDLPNLKNLKGVNADSIHCRIGPGSLKLESFEGIPKELTGLTLNSAYLSQLFIDDINNNKILCPTIKCLFLGYITLEDRVYFNNWITNNPNIEGKISNFKLNQL